MKPLVRSRTRETPRAAARRAQPSNLSGTSLGLRATRTTDLIHEVERGFSFRTVKTFAAATALPVGRIADLLNIPERTLARRRVSGRLAPDESERLLRLSRVFEKAVRLFEGDSQAAVAWLTSPKKAFGAETPLTYSRTELGAREVENLIGGLEHGVFA